MLHRLGAVAVLVALSLSNIPADAGGVRAAYTKHEFHIPMRDGAKLFTIVYVPKDETKSYPIMLQRTPYGVAPYGVQDYRHSLGPSEHFEKDGFIFAYQDVRGRHMSEGKWVEMRPHLAEKHATAEIDESSDTYDTVAWLLEHVPRNSGRVGLWGISYAGFYAAAALPGAHPAVVAVSPQAPIADLFMGDDGFHNGAFMLAANFGFYTSFRPRSGGPAVPRPAPAFNYGTPDGYDFFRRMGGLAEGTARLLARNEYWSPYLEHTTYDEFWQVRAIVPHLKGIKPAVLTVGGWFDAEDLAGSLAVYRAIEKNNPGATNQLVMGPWVHGGWARGDGDRLGHVSFAVKTGPYFREQIEHAFFAHHLKHRPLAHASEASVFVTGRNEWRTHDTWPPTGAVPQTFYLQPRGALGREHPSTAGADAMDEYVSDPNRPVPYVGSTTIGMRRDYMIEDQRFAAARPDVLVYQTGLLEADLTVAGPIDVSLHVSTTGTDADFVVKMIDVYPGRLGGYQQLVRGEPFRGKFRRSFERPIPFVPGEPAVIGFTMPDVYHTFRAGHRVMVHVQSSWFPLVDRNPQQFMDIPKATARDFLRQTHRVFRSRDLPSSITLNVVPER
jgi:putative CocE/NonD family hydrolase